MPSSDIIWTPQTHHLFPRYMQYAIIALTFVKCKPLGKEVSNNGEGSYLPIELVEYIAEFL